jgi:hypothetical protein
MTTTKGTPKTLQQAIEWGLNQNVSYLNNGLLAKEVEQAVELFLRERFGACMLEHFEYQRAEDAIADLFMSITWKKALLSVIERALNEVDDDIAINIHNHIVDFLIRCFADARIEHGADARILGAFKDLFFELTLLNLFEEELYEVRSA